MVFDFLAPRKKVVIAMIHVRALPGTPLYDADGGMEALIDGARSDAEKLKAAGVDAVMFGNENDRPYVFSAPPAGIAAFTTVINAVTADLDLPFGVNYLWDPIASTAIGATTGAKFVREIFTGLFASDMGLWEPNAAAALRLRRDLGRTDMKTLFNINAEFAHSLDQRPIALRAKSAVFSSLADAVLVSGPITGQPAEHSDLRAVKEALPDTPVLANTGVNIDTIADVFAVADGAIVGSHFKTDGDTWKSVDADRARRFMDKVNLLR
ncbi:BtpA/SgcQ family protein [Arsenicitalea aurantiaca]|uniref:BtpA/SgcQ family protein n=1 Tax=Arsenicitalea aurantiaca TaxID=1783274 RepID=A0A433XBV2_9HYPH|nr:BtpA/SgcQ family protein [Arsenicitalea aurantiaca]RUT31418.1 BtpA/SgcQ family protein [Arsenicitalea aurantiaca]